MVHVCSQHILGSHPRRYSILSDLWMGPTLDIEATLSLGNSKRRDVEPRRWWYHTQSQYKRARAAVNNRLKTAIQNWAERRNADP